MVLILIIFNPIYKHNGGARYAIRIITYLNDGNSVDNLITYIAKLSNHNSHISIIIRIACSPSMSINKLCDSVGWT